MTKSHTEREIETHEYRPELDGLRGIAVLLVILYHARFSYSGMVLLEGGYVGVDIFFVLSGYLISKILYQEVKNSGRLNLSYFYERRARRLLPALLVVMLFSIPFSWVLMLPESMKEYAWSVLSSLSFISNFYFYFESTQYGAESSILKPLLHTWSLSVEEQFYLIFPLFILAATRNVPGRLFSWIIFGIALSLSYSITTANTNPELNFFNSIGRFWEILIGALIAVLEMYRGSPVQAKNNGIMSLLGLSMVVFSAANFDSATKHPGVITLIPVAGSALLIFFSARDSLIKVFLSAAPLRFLGLISYSAYLWHYPVFSYLYIYDPLIDNYSKISALFLTLALSVLTYRLIEKPFRSRTLVSRQRLFFFISINIFVLIAIMSLIIQSGGFKGRFNLLASSAEEMEFYKKEYWNDFTHFYNEQKGVIKPFPMSNDIKVYVIGNSWGFDVARGLAAIPSIKVQFKKMSGHKCEEFVLPTYGPSIAGHEKWKQTCALNEVMFKETPANTDVIVLADNRFLSGQYDSPLTHQALLSNIELLKESSDARIVVVKGRPTWKESGWRMMLGKQRILPSLNNEIQQLLNHDIQSLRQTDAYYKKHLASINVEYIGLVDAFCAGGICKMFGHNEIYYFDRDHLTLEGSRLAATYLAKFLAE